MTALSSRTRDLLDRPSAAFLAAVDPAAADGAPTLDPVWVGRDGDRVLAATERRLTGPAGAAPDALAVTLSVAGPGSPADRIVLRGRASVATGDAASAHLGALAAKYLVTDDPAGVPALTVLVLDVTSAEEEPAGLLTAAAGPDLAANRAVVVEMLDALARGDRDRARAAFAVEATWQCPPSMPWPPFYEGRDAIFDEYFAVDVDLFETGVSEYDLEVLNAVAERDQVSVEMRHRGVGLGGQPYETDHSVIYVVRGGLIVAVREYIDTLYLTRALLG
jgi:ketosteroid isomerase-like protein